MCDSAVPIFEGCCREVSVVHDIRLCIWRRVEEELKIGVRELNIYQVSVYVRAGILIFHNKTRPFQVVELCRSSFNITATSAAFVVVLRSVIDSRFPGLCISSCYYTLLL
jgi:hypothetical protein